MSLYDKAEIVAIGSRLKTLRPDLWLLIFNRESIDGIYEYDEEMKLYEFIRDSIPEIDTIKSTTTFFGLRVYVAHSMGIKNYFMEF